MELVLLVLPIRDASVTEKDGACNRLRGAIQTRPNKSLDASGGSVLRIIIGAAMLDLIRAAASTQPLGRSFLCQQVWTFSYYNTYTNSITAKTT
jgi:hypothetical protein